ncbi:hypothetical protein CABS03_05352 [Colletotrichum abscissum]|uniref:Uncharacterized protein n=1 Tax=Colletotrichum abscissum TaxID=1671311 RepID=A0A9Q0AYP7_9PEZI|nr:hypothetical protein CABS02_12633 [Colletotrichum abscissum]
MTHKETRECANHPTFVAQRMASSVFSGRNARARCFRSFSSHALG